VKKIPTLFTRVFGNHRVVDIKDEITPGCEDAFLHGDATIKLDGACCAIINGVFYKRYDAKKGKKPPAGAIPCCDADPVTGHHPHWVKVDRNNPDDKWFVRAADNTPVLLCDGTYEAIGKHFNSNPYGLCDDILEPHGVKKVEVERTFEGIQAYLEANNVEGLVFWLNGEPVCKIKRSDFGLAWPAK
jgi:hypothetical protein